MRFREVRCSVDVEQNTGGYRPFALPSVNVITLINKELGEVRNEKKRGSPKMKVFL